MPSRGPAVDRHPNFQKRVDAFEEFWIGKLREATDLVLARIQLWQIFKVKQDAVPAGFDRDQYEEAIDDLLLLFEGTITREELLERYGFFLRMTYDDAILSVLGEFPHASLGFGQPDYEFLSFMQQQAPGIFEKYFGYVGKWMRTAIIEGMARGENWHQIQRRLEKAFQMSQSRAETIIRTELARAMVEGRLLQYAKTGLVDEVEWLAEPFDHFCSRTPICEAMNGEKFNLDDARGEIPAHPRCRCDFAPVV